MVLYHKGIKRDESFNQNKTSIETSKGSCILHKRRNETMKTTGQLITPAPYFLITIECMNSVLSLNRARHIIKELYDAVDKTLYGSCMVDEICDGDGYLEKIILHRANSKDGNDLKGRPVEKAIQSVFAYLGQNYDFVPKNVAIHIE